METEAKKIDGAGADVVEVGDTGGPGRTLAEIPDGAMMDLKALADALGICTRTARRAIRRGELPPGIGMGRRRIWTAGRVRAWLDRRADEAEREAERERSRIQSCARTKAS